MWRLMPRARPVEPSRSLLEQSQLIKIDATGLSRGDVTFAATKSQLTKLKRKVWCSGERDTPRDKPVASAKIEERSSWYSGERDTPRDKPVASSMESDF
jgi:hypothetical protein